MRIHRNRQRDKRRERGKEDWKSAGDSNGSGEYFHARRYTDSGGKLIFLGLSGWNDSRKLSRRHKSHIHERQGRWNTFFLPSFQRDEIKTFFNSTFYEHRHRAQTSRLENINHHFPIPFSSSCRKFSFPEQRTETRIAQDRNVQCMERGGEGNANYSINEMIHVSLRFLCFLSTMRKERF